MGDRVLGQGIVLARGIVLASLCLGLVLTAPASALADTLFASPDGGLSGDCKSVGDACRIDRATEIAVDEDSVVVTSGVYDLAEIASGGLVLDKKIDFGGDPGESERPVLLTEGDRPLHVFPDADATVHDLTLEGSGSLWLESGLAERVFVSSSTESPLGIDTAAAACSVQLSTGFNRATIRDSVCWVNNQKGPGKAAALRMTGTTENDEKSVVTLRNVTAIGGGTAGRGIEALAFNSSALAIDAKNVIARALASADVYAAIDDVKTSRVEFNLAASNFATVDSDPGSADVTPATAAGNQTAAPEFIDATDGDFRAAPSSPTLDAGVVDSLVGAVDIDGVSRPQASCLGPKAKVAADIGAYERLATTQCTPDPLPPLHLAEPFVPRFRILRVKLNKRNGSGSVQIEAPGPGTASVSGSGIKFLRRTAPAAGSKVTIPIRPWAVTLVRLNKVGRVKLRLRVQFDASAGGSQTTARPVTLKLARRPG